MRTFSDNSAVRRSVLRSLVPAPSPEPGTRTAARFPAALLPWSWAAAFFLLYATVAVRRHLLLRTTGYDLGIFEQAIRAYSQLRAPIVPLRGENFHLLGDHFHPALAVLAPLYRLWPSPLCLLLAQSALLALGAVPLVAWAQRVLGRRPAHAVALGYGLSWGIASAAAFDFHEVALAVPLLSFAVVALGRRRWGAAVAWAAPLVLVKEDLGLTLAALGCFVAWKGPRLLGVVTAAAGVVASVIEIKVLLPAFNPAGGYAHGVNLGEGSHSTLLGTLVFAPLDVLRPDIKAMTLILVFAPSALLALRSPLALLAVPTLAWRMLSQNGFHWGTSFHYSAVLMPIVFAGLIDTLRRWGSADHPLAARQVRASLATVLAVTVVMLPSFPWPSWRSGPPGAPHRTSRPPAPCWRGSPTARPSPPPTAWCPSSLHAATWCSSRPSRSTPGSTSTTRTGCRARRPSGSSTTGRRPRPGRTAPATGPIRPRSRPPNSTPPSAGTATSGSPKRTASP